MNASGQPVEVRIFKGHAQLSRVEATWTGSNDKLIKLTLVDGRTVQIKTTRVKDLRSAPTSLLLQLAKAAK